MGIFYWVSSLRQETIHPKYKFGIITECNPASKAVDVQLSEGDYVTGVPILNTYGAAHATDMSWLTDLRGAYVLVLELAGKHFIAGTIPQEVSDTSTSNTIPVFHEGFGGSNQDTYARSVYKNFQSGRPVDYFTGDKILRAGNSSTFGLFREGSSVWKVSSLTQIVLGKFKDFIRMIGRRFQIYSDFGEMHLEHSATGRVRASLHGGADFSTETHPTVAKWTVQAWLGDDDGNNPDNRLHIRVNDVDNAEYVTMEFDIKMKKLRLIVIGLKISQEMKT